jgi:hypothetical protein
MFHVVDTTTGETVYRHYDKTECTSWITDNSSDAASYRIEYVRPANGISGLAWTD